MGCVYVLSNKYMPGILKIGCTNRTAEERRAELSAASGVPVPFTIEYQRETEHPFLLEIGVHERLDLRRVSDAREFFAVDVGLAVDAIASVAVSELYWRRCLASLWGAAPQDWRERALERMDAPVMDGGRFGA